MIIFFFFFFFLAQILAAEVCCDGYDAVVSAAGTGETEERVSWSHGVTNTANFGAKMFTMRYE